MLLGDVVNKTVLVDEFVRVATRVSVTFGVSVNECSSLEDSLCERDAVLDAELVCVMECSRVSLADAECEGDAEELNVCDVVRVDLKRVAEPPLLQLSESDLADDGDVVWLSSRDIEGLSL